MWDLIIGNFNKTLSGSTLHARRWVGLLWFFAPLLIFVFSYLTTRDMGACVKFRPPSETYQVMWIILVLTLMVSWLGISRSASLDSWIFLTISYFLTIGLSISWLFFYRVDKLKGIPVFIALIAVLFASLHIASYVNKFSAALLWPLLVWAIFQLCVNASEVSCDV